MTQRANFTNALKNCIKNTKRNIELDEKVLDFKKTLQEAFTNKVSNSRIIKGDDIKKLNKEFDVLYPSIGENLDFLYRELKDITKLHFISSKEDIFC